VKALQPDNALKVRIRKFSKQTLTCTRRYALLQNLRIGLRFVGEWAYLWKMTDEQIKAAEKKAERLVAARAKKGKKS